MSQKLSKGVMFWVIAVMAYAFYVMTSRNPIFDYYAAFRNIPRFLTTMLFFLDIIFPFALICVTIGLLITVQEIFRKSLIFIMFYDFISNVLSFVATDKKYMTTMYQQFAENIVNKAPDFNMQSAYNFVVYSFIIWGVMVTIFDLLIIFFFTRSKVKGQFK